MFWACQTRRSARGQDELFKGTRGETCTNGYAGIYKDYPSNGKSNGNQEKNGMAMYSTLYYVCIYIYAYVHIGRSTYVIVHVLFR